MQQAFRNRAEMIARAADAESDRFDDIERHLPFSIILLRAAGHAVSNIERRAPPSAASAGCQYFYAIAKIYAYAMPLPAMPTDAAAYGTGHFMRYEEEAISVRGLSAF